VLVVFLDVEDDGTGELDLRQQVEVSQNEENLALGLKLSDHVLLVGEQVVIEVVVALLVLLVREVATVVENVIFAILAVPEREDIVAALDDKEREIKVGKLEIDVTDLASRLGWGA